MIHVAITRRVRPGCEQELEDAVAKISLEAEREPGAEGAFLLRPAEPGSRDYGILHTFTSRAARDRFFASEPYARFTEAIAPLVEGPPRRRDIRGLEGYFVAPSAGGPPAWKMALITWLAVNPAVFVCIRVVKAVLGEQPELVELLVGNTLVIALLTWVLMPALTRIFARWLRTPPPEGATTVPA